MAVPSSGNSLSLYGVSKELTHNDYNNTIPPPGSGGTDYSSYFFTAISLNDCETQGNTYGSTAYDAINTASSSRPDGSNPNELSEWYSYNHTAVSSCLTRTNYDWTLNNPTGCSISTAFSGSTSVNQYASIRYARFDAEVDGVFTCRIYRNSSSGGLETQVYKSNGQVSGSGHSISGMTLQETVGGSGYTTVSFPVSANDEILIRARHLYTTNFFSVSLDRCFINDLSSCQYTTYTTAKLFGPHTSTSSTYHSTSASTVLSAASYNSYSSSAWSTVYIHHCTSTNPIEEGNTVYTSSALTTKIGWSSNSSWRAISTDTTFPISGIKAIYNGFHYSTTNIENTSGDTN